MSVSFSVLTQSETLTMLTSGGRRRCTLCTKPVHDGWERRAVLINTTGRVCLWSWQDLQMKRECQELTLLFTLCVCPGPGRHLTGVNFTHWRCFEQCFHSAFLPGCNIETMLPCFRFSALFICHCYIYCCDVYDWHDSIMLFYSNILQYISGMGTGVVTNSDL